jgi:hypothetical protein
MGCTIISAQSTNFAMLAEQDFSLAFPSEVLVATVEEA